MLRRMFVVGIIVLALLIAFGCSSDEDCPTCPAGSVDTVTVTETITDTVNIGETDTLTDTLTDTVTVLEQPPTYINAYIQDECGVGVFRAKVYPNSGSLVAVDSFQVGDSVCYDVPVTTYWDESDPYYNLSLRDVNAMFQRGLEATATIWGDNRSVTATVVVMNPCQDYPVYVVPNGGDTIETVQSQVVCEWELREFAEWYGIQEKFYRDSSGVTVNRDKFTFTYDTTHTVLDTAFGYPADSVKLWVLPTNGPDPTSTTGNWDGDLATGRLYAPGVSNLANIRFVSPTVLAKVKSVDETISDNEFARAMIEKIFEAYK